MRWRGGAWHGALLLRRRGYHQGEVHLAACLPAACLTCLPACHGCADFHWLPTADMLGHSPGQVAVALLAVLPVISLSFICQ